ncbi:MAG: Dabb family protein [Pseudomonadota bacterium]
MIRHCAFLALVEDADRAELADVMRGLGSLVGALNGCANFAAGPNRVFEGKSPDYPYGFTFDAADAGTLATYAAHPTHKALAARLVALCAGGAAGITVYDIERDGT